MNAEEMRERVASAPVGRLATIDPDGRPNVVPFVFVLDGERLYTTVDAKPKRTRRLRRVTNLERDPRATVLVDRYDDDWHRLWWVRLRGTGRVVEDEPERGRALAALHAKYSQYQNPDPEQVVIAIDIEEWRGWAWTE